jgi:hypothetical protein
MRKNRDDETLRREQIEPEPAEIEPGVMDAAESRWDPWLLALARMEAADALPMN